MDLRASALTNGDLPSALAAAARHWAAGMAVAVETRVTGARRSLPEDVEQNVLRIAQEAVTNALKHSGAKTIRIDLQTDARKLQLSVRDDGRGFDLAGAFVSVGGHFGLLGMRERAERLGGELELSSEPGAGTVVKASVPLSSEPGRKGVRRRLWGLLRMPERPVRL